jgi:hypothetical protein
MAPALKEHNPVLKLLRFSNLKAAGIVNNWPGLKRKIDRENFPLGRLIGPNTRAWTEEEVQAWLDSRPTARKPVHPASKPRGRPRKHLVTQTPPIE